MFSFIKSFYTNTLRFSFDIIIIAICIPLFFTGYIFDFEPSAQILMKKIGLVSVAILHWYLSRRLIIGKINWNEEFTFTPRNVFAIVMFIAIVLSYAIGM